MLPKGSHSKGLVSNVALLGGGGTFKRKGLLRGLLVRKGVALQEDDETPGILLSLSSQP
jgi:hypothetical protein